MDNAQLLDEKYKVSTSMMHHGGSFAIALGQALAVADLENAQKIHDTWDSMWVSYLNDYVIFGLEG